ncbi:MAG TPA: VWA domain-containing protein [Polyangiales bacterium]
MSDSSGWGRAWIACAVLLVVACGKDRVVQSGDAGWGDSEDTLDAGKPAPKPVEEDCPPSNPYCDDEQTKGEQKPTTPVCGNSQINLDTVGVNVMIAVDGSASMSPHWTRIQEAVSRLRDAHPDAAFGVHVFWGNVSSFEEARQKANWCGTTQNKFLDVGANSSQELTSLMGASPPGPGFLGIWETSPVIDPLNYYLTNATKLADPARTNYLILISDGNDNCFGSVYANQQDKLLAYEKIAVELGKRNIRVLPIGFDAVSAATWNGNYFTTPPTTNTEVLGTLLKYGGSGLSELPKVDDPSKFAEVLEQVGLRVRSCRFSIPKISEDKDVNPFELAFTVNGTELPRDRTNQNGWNFVSDDIQQIEIFGNACQAVRTGAPVKTAKSCAGYTCGSSAVEVKTKPRAVLYLLDSSASRIECADGTFNCLLTIGMTNRTSLSFWEVVEHALGQTLVEPINDDVEFGMQFFPSRTQRPLSCDVATGPEIAPAPGVQIQILSEMLGKLPIGFSPVVAGLESVAANPGRLADAEVQGAVVMLTDGGDNCTGATQEEVVTRLGTAAKSLLDRGVKTYVVRYGSPNGKSPEQEAQLRAIVGNGGTARSDVADMTMVPYVDAKDESELSAALAELSDKLATCEISVGAINADADKQQANLYLNGVVVPQRSATSENGWTWKDDAQTTIELHGPSCDEFKTARKTSVIIEFGCAPIFVM